MKTRNGDCASGVRVLPAEDLLPRRPPTPMQQLKPSTMFSICRRLGAA